MSRNYNLKLKFSPEEAADFLEISPLSLVKLTTSGYVTKYKFKSQEYYLAGALEAVKPQVKQFVRELSISTCVPSM